MCKGCEDHAEFERVVDAWIERELPRMIAQPIDASLLRGRDEWLGGNIPTPGII